MAEQRQDNGKYRANFTYRDPETGIQQRCRQSLGTRNRREAERREVELRLKLEQPPQEGKRKKRAAFSGFAKHWLDNYVAILCKPATLRSYKQALRVHLVPFFQDRELREISPEEVSLMVAKLHRGGSAPKHINNIKGVLSSMFTKAIEWGYAEQNPARMVKALRYRKPDVDFWESEQSEAFLAKVRELRPRWYPFFLCALRTGMRMGELVGLEWGDVDFVIGELHINKSYSHGHLTTPKSGRSRRVPMTPELIRALKAHRHVNGELVFPWSDGSYLPNNRIKHPFWTCIKAAGVKKIRFHDLRHTFASQLVMKGAPMRVVQELLGHSTLQMTMRYAHLSPSAKTDAVAVLDAGAAPILPHFHEMAAGSGA